MSFCQKSVFFYCNKPIDIFSVTYAYTEEVGRMLPT